MQTTGASVRVSSASGVDIASAQYRYSSDGGANWTEWLGATTRGSSTDLLAIASSVPFGQDSLALDRDQIAFRVRNSVGDWESSPAYIVYIDSTPPAYPEYLSASRPAGTWSNDTSAITFAWSAAVDVPSGVAGYSYGWSNAPDTIPDAVLMTTALSLQTPIPDDGIWYFHLRVVDHAGNWSTGAAHSGPFWLDTVPPWNLTTAYCPSHMPGIWSNDNTVDCQWSGAGDYRSGVAGYAYAWDQSASTVPDATLDTVVTSITGPALTDGTDWYLHLRAIDQAGNAASGASHLGPFYIDTIAPGSEVYIQDPYQGRTEFTVQWFGHPGAGSPIEGYDVQVTDQFGGTSTTSLWQSDTTLGSGTYTGAVLGHNYCFSSRARDTAGNLEAYPPTPDDCTLIGAPTQVTVTDEFGNAKQGARVYHRDHFIGLTDAQGRITLSNAMFGDHLVAMVLVSTQGSGKGSHQEDSFKNWSWRVYRTNLSFDATGAPQWDTVSTVSSVYNQTVPVYRNWPLIGMHMVVSVEWDADAAYLNDLAQGLRAASTYLYDLGDGQFFWEVIEVFDNGAHWNEADMHVYASSQMWPKARVWGITQGSGAHIHLPPTFTRSGTNGSYTLRDGFSAMIHEFGHYGLGLWDEYLDRDGNKTPDAFCASNFNTQAYDAAASVMYHEWQVSELCSRVDPNHQHRSNTEHDSETGGESLWETVLRRFSDPNVNPYWFITTPDRRGSTMPGPTAIPVPEWMRVLVTNANTGACAPFTQSFTMNGKPAAGADVWVDPQGIWWQFPYTVYGLYQGRTDAAGTITIRGAHNGDLILAMSLPNVGAAQASCTAATAMALGAQVEMAPAPFSLSVSVAPLSATAAWVEVTPSVALSTPPVVVVKQEGTWQGIPVTVAWDAGRRLYAGQVSLDANLALAGYVLVRGEAGGAIAEARSPFTLEVVTAGQYTHLMSADDNLELVLRAGSLAQDAVVSIQQVSVGTARQGSLVRVSPAYLVSLSGGGLVGTATVHMRYLTSQLGGVMPETLRLYRWDDAGGAWLPLPSSLGADLSLVSDSQVTQPGVFALLGTGSRSYLPAVMGGHR